VLVGFGAGAVVRAGVFVGACVEAFVDALVGVAGRVGAAVSAVGGPEAIEDPAALGGALDAALDDVKGARTAGGSLASSGAASGGGADFRVPDLELSSTTMTVMVLRVARTARLMAAALGSQLEGFAMDASSGNSAAAKRPNGCLRH
jgi:hypothetical protein